MKRWTCWIVMLLLAGAVVNIAVAWGCGALIDISTGNKPRIHSWWNKRQFSVICLECSSAAAYHVMIGKPRRSSWDTGDPKGLKASFPLEFESILENPALRTESQHYFKNLWIEHTVVDFRGWPCLSMYSFPQAPTRDQLRGRRVRGALNTLTYRDRTLWGIDLDRESRSGSYVTYMTGGSWHGRILPLHPLWPGFAFNTLVFAIALLVLIQAPVIARWFIRKRNGRCTKCGYDRRANSGSTCPECGNTVQLRSLNPPKGT